MVWATKSFKIEKIKTYEGASKKARRRRRKTKTYGGRKKIILEIIKAQNFIIKIRKTCLKQRKKIRHDERC
jgi:hypothetical protein